MNKSRSTKARVSALVVATTVSGAALWWLTAGPVAAGDTADELGTEAEQVGAREAGTGRNDSGRRDGTSAGSRKQNGPPRASGGRTSTTSRKSTLERITDWFTGNGDSDQTRDGSGDDPRRVAGRAQAGPERGPGLVTPVVLTERERTSAGRGSPGNQGDGPGSQTDGDYGANSDATSDERPPTCDNGVLDPGEECDTPFSENCSADCTPISSPRCQDCVKAKCAGAETCAGFDGGPEDEQLCNAVLNCVRASGCADGGFPLFCYCGAVTDAECDQGNAAGPCKELIEDGLNSIEPNFIQQNFGELVLPAGRALARVECERSSCREDVKPSCP